jgi:hypothetical protein
MQNNNNNNNNNSISSSSSMSSNSPVNLRKNRTFGSFSSMKMKTASSGNFSNCSSSSSSTRDFLNGSAGSSANFTWNSSAVVQVAQRSNGATVKSVIAELDQAISDAVHNIGEETNDATTQTHIPLQLCSMLAQWARVDAYYKVVITKYNGVPVIVRAMKTFPKSEDLQALCCSTLSSLTNKLKIYQEGGVHVILEALKMHPNCISVQSSALEALSGVMPLITRHVPCRSKTASAIDCVEHEASDDDKQELLREIQTVVTKSKDMYLTENGVNAANDILAFLENRKP